MEQIVYQKVHLELLELLLCLLSVKNRSILGHTLRGYTAMNSCLLMKTGPAGDALLR